MLHSMSNLIEANGQPETSIEFVDTYVERTHELGEANDGSDIRKKENQMEETIELMDESDERMESSLTPALVRRRKYRPPEGFFSRR